MLLPLSVFGKAIFREEGLSQEMNEEEDAYPEILSDMLGAPFMDVLREHGEAYINNMLPPEE